MSKQAFMILPKLGVFLLAVASLLVSSHGTDTHLLRGKLQETASDLEVTTTTGNRKTYIKSPSIGSISVVRVFYSNMFSNPIPIIFVLTYKCAFVFDYFFQLTPFLGAQRL